MSLAWNPYEFSVEPLKITVLKLRLLEIDGNGSFSPSKVRQNWWFSLVFGLFSRLKNHVFSNSAFLANTAMLTKITVSHFFIFQLFSKNEDF